jgi:hypothetical protein
MKLKSLLFGSAAVVAAGTGAQAADLPIVEPVEYVRICDAFGTGYYYIPGTDTCLRVAGRVRVDSYYTFGDNDKDFGIGINDGDKDEFEFWGNDKDEFNNWGTRARGYVRLDARTQTDLGLVRAYVSLHSTVGPSGFAENYDSAGIELEEAFIQISNDWGTYTAGHTGSFFDFYGTNVYNASIGVGGWVDDPTGEQTLFAWTFAGGNGFSATLSLEDPASGGRRYNPAFDQDFGGGGIFFGKSTGDYEGQEFPDFVGNIRLDQGWGSAQLSGVLHGIHESENDIFVDDDDDFDGDNTEFGFAIAAGLSLTIPAPMALEFNAQATYGEGALGYVTTDPAGFGDYFEGKDFDDDDDDTFVETNSAWSIRAGFSLGFTETLTAYVDGSFTHIEAGDTDELFDDDDDDDDDGYDYSLWGIAADLVWNPVSGLTIGPEIGYKKIEFGDAFDDFGECADDDDDDDDCADFEDDVFGIMWRIQRDF